MSEIDVLTSEFIAGADEFYGDTELDDIDKKHVGIVRKAYEQFSQNINNNNYRNWDGQSDQSAPKQLSLDMMRYFGVFHTFVHYVHKKIFRRSRENNMLSSMLDDINIIEEVGGLNYLYENPVHKTPGTDRFYQTKMASFNSRWLKYIYLTTRIINDGLLSDGGIWVDIGPYYGGLQGLIRKYQPKSKMVLVDFHHQLCRSYIYLNKLYPQATHILPNMIKDYSDLDTLPEGSIAYVPTSSYSLIKDNQVDLATNFYSFGEMRRKIFKDYYRSVLFDQSKISYIVNRFVSSPFFEPTYDTDLNIYDYKSDKRVMKYLDVFPIHHYNMLYRELFGRKHSRNTSSSYFEMITSKHN